MKRRVLCLAVLVLLLSIPALAHAADGIGYAIDWWTVDGGGVVSSGGDFGLGSTAGQPDAGVLSGGAYTLQGGFWFTSASQPVYLPLIVRN